ncbi:MAG: recombinase family protein [Candidatus Pacearchaeota archaeon]|nr:recombinase family protein [Candidatus Pacearchaeota archaeon]
MKCEKCGYESEENKKFREAYLCQVCRQFAPSENLQDYLNEKVDSKALESFRRFSKANISGMKEKFKQGNIMSRAAYGYKIVNKELVPDEEKKILVQGIFQDFLNQDASLNALAKKYGFSVNGLKKILKNFTYLGKVKFSGGILQGKHQPIISSELFNKVQNKLEDKS